MPPKGTLSQNFSKIREKEHLVCTFIQYAWTSISPTPRRQKEKATGYLKKLQFGACLDCLNPRHQFWLRISSPTAASLPAGCAKSLTCPGNPPVQEKRPALRNKGRAAEKPAETDPRPAARSGCLPCGFGCDPQIAGASGGGGSVQELTCRRPCSEPPRSS